MVIAPCNVKKLENSEEYVNVSKNGNIYMMNPDVPDWFL